MNSEAICGTIILLVALAAAIIVVRQVYCAVAKTDNDIF